tara:strand:- start:417 stop:656 length:240 start_codon:yes stop_codon:yes gene_type:complete
MKGTTNQIAKCLLDALGVLPPPPTAGWMTAPELAAVAVPVADPSTMRSRLEKAVITGEIKKQLFKSRKSSRSCTYYHLT